MHPLLRKREYPDTQFVHNKCTRSVSLAQLVEQLTLNQWVESSSLSGDTKDTFECLFFVFLFIFWQKSSFIFAHVKKMLYLCKCKGLRIIKLNIFMKKLFFLLMTLLMAVAMQGQTVSFTASEWASAQSLSEGASVTTYSQNNVTVTFAQGNGANAVTWNATQSAVAAVSGNTMTISVADGYEMTSAVFSMYRVAQATNLAGATWSAGSASANDVQATWTGRAQSVTVDINNVARFVSFTITVEEAAAPEQPEDESMYNDTTVFSFTEWISDEGFSDAENFDLETYSQDNKSLTMSKETGNQPTCYTDHVYFKQNNTLTLTAPFMMRKIVLTFSSANHATYFLEGRSQGGKTYPASTCSTGSFKADSENKRKVIWRGSTSSLTITIGTSVDIEGLIVISDSTNNNATVIFLGLDGSELARQSVSFGNAATAPTLPVSDKLGMVIHWDTDFSQVYSDLTVRAIEEPIVNLDLTPLQCRDLKTQITNGVSFTSGNATIGLTGNRASEATDWAQSEGKVVIFAGNTINVTSSDLFRHVRFTCLDATVATRMSTAACSLGTLYQNDNVVTWKGETNTLTITAPNWEIGVTNFEVYSTPAPILVTFLDRDGNILKIDTVQSGSAAVAPEAPVITGYTFTGWSVDFSNVTDDITTQAQYTLIDGYMLVTFTDLLGNEIETQVVQIGEDVVAPAVPALKYHTFTGWDHELTNLTENTVIKALYTFDLNSPDIMTVTEWATLLQQSDVEREKWEEGEEGLRPGEAYAVKGVFYETTALGLESDGRYSFILTEDGQDHGDTRVIAVQMLDPNKEPFYSTMQLNQGDTAIIYGTFGRKEITIPYQGGEWYTGIIEGYVPYIGKDHGDGNAVYIDLPRAEALYDFSGNGLKQAPIVEVKTTQDWISGDTWYLQYTTNVTLQLTADVTEQFRPKELYGKITHVYKGEEPGLGDANIAYVEDVNHDGQAALSSFGAGTFAKTANGCERIDGLAVTNMDINCDGRIDYLILDQSRTMSNRATAYYGAVAYQLPDGSFQEERMQVFTWDEFVAQMTSEELDQYQNPQNYSLGEVSRYTYTAQLGGACLVRAPRRNAPDIKKAPGVGTLIGAPTKVIDMNKDGLMDLIDEKSGIIYTNMDNGKWVWTTTNGAVVPADLNNDGVLDFVFPGDKLYSVIYNKTTKTFDRTLLYQNAASDDIVYCDDFDKDGDIDILATFTAENNTTGYAYTCFFTNNGQGVFTQQPEQNYGSHALVFVAMQDLDGDGYYDLLAYNPTSNNKYNLVWIKGQSGLRFNTTPQVLAADAITRQTYWDSSKQPFSDYPVNAEDLDGDGKLEIWVSGTYYGSTALYTIEGSIANERPAAPAQPTLNYNNGILSISWGNGSDDKTATGDLTYALRIGTTQGGNDILAAHANADGTRRNFLDGNMGKEHTYTIDLTSYSPATIYVAVQAIDAQHAGSAWSTEATAVHDLVPIDFSLDRTTLNINETIELTYTALPEGYTHQWTIQDGSYAQSSESASKLILSFTSGGTKTIIHTVTMPNGGTLTASATILVLPAGVGEPIALESSDTRINILSAPMADFTYDGRMDGVLSTDIYSGSYYALIVEEGVENTNLFANSPGLWNTNIITDGYHISEYSTYNDIFWYDWNKDGHVDMLLREYYHSNTSTYYSYAYLPHDANNSLSVRVDDPNLESFFTERQQSEVPYDNYRYALTDLDNNGYLDSVAFVHNPAAGTNQYGDDIYGLYAWFKEEDNILAEGFLIPSVGYSSSVRECYLTPNDHCLLVNSTLYPIVTQADARPAAPTNIQASMTNEGLLITWTPAVDDHTPAANMRYNLAVKQQGAATYVISPQNGGNENAAFIPGFDYYEGTSLLIPTSDLANGTYEIAMQALDRQNKLSVFSQTITASVTRNPIELPSFACAYDEVTVSYRGAETTGTPSWNFDGGIAEGYDFGPYTVTWTTGGEKTVTLTLNGQTYSATITIDDPATLQVTIPTTLYEETPASATIPEGIEYQWFASIDGSELYPIDQYGIMLPTTSVFASYDRRLTVQGLNVTAHYVQNQTSHSLTNSTVLLYLQVTNANGCEAYFSSDVTVLASTNIPELTLVTTDASGHNVISWTNADAFQTVNIYKEGTSLNDFQLLGSIAAEEGSFTDSYSDATQKAERYRLTGVTAEGSESPESTIHKTVHLTINRGVVNGTFNLIWNEYAGAEVTSYRILRGATPASLEQIAVVAASNTSFTDQTPVDSQPYYAIEYVLSSAAAAPSANRAPKASISGRSNVVDRKSLEEGIEDIPASETPHKVMIDNTIYILRGDRIFTLSGQEIK